MGGKLKNIQSWERNSSISDWPKEALVEVIFSGAQTPKWAHGGPSSETPPIKGAVVNIVKRTIIFFF